MSTAPYTGSYLGNYNGDTPPMRLGTYTADATPRDAGYHAARAEQLIDELFERHNARMAELATARRQRQFAKNWRKVSKP